MKYFTPELWLHMQSGVDRATFLNAYETWERNVDAYEEQLRRIIPPGRAHHGLRQYARQASLHGGTVLGGWFASPGRLHLLVQPPAPADQLLCLDYVLDGEPVVVPDQLPPDYRTARMGWLYDEIDMAHGAAEPVFTHHILLSDGREVVLRFRQLKVSRRQGLLPELPAPARPLPALSQPA